MIRELGKRSVQVTTNGSTPELHNPVHAIYFHVGRVTFGVGRGCLRERLTGSGSLRTYLGKNLGQYLPRSISGLS